MDIWWSCHIPPHLCGRIPTITSDLHGSGFHVQRAECACTCHLCTFEEPPGGCGLVSPVQWVLQLVLLISLSSTAG